MKRTIGWILLLGFCSLIWSGCARPDLGGRMESEPGDVEKLRERLGKIEW